VHLEASTKPHFHKKFEIFWTNIASNRACPNFTNGLKNDLGLLGVNVIELGKTLGRLKKMTLGKDTPFTLYSVG
jgi:hypothetical protein